MTLTIIFRCLILYFLVLILLRVMGKRQIGEMQPFELVMTLIIADLATIPMGETALPLLHGIIPLLTLAILHFFLSLLSRKSAYFRKKLNGKPVIVIGPNGIDYKALKSLNMNFNDLIESIHTDGYFNLNEILYAIVQTNGTVSVLPRSQFAPVSASTLNVETDETSLPIILLSEGRLNKENLKVANLDEAFLLKSLSETKHSNLKDILLITINKAGEMYIMPKNGGFEFVKTNYKGEKNW